jgi:hypothetical protein
MPNQPQTQAWEYKLVSMGNPLEPDVELRANVLGKQGWELSAIDAGVWIFKRAASEETASGALEAIIEETIAVAGTTEQPAVAVGELRS